MKLKISELRLNTNNPRVIKDIKFKKLVSSIIEFPEMLELRPIVIDENNVILGGNMRYRACKEAGLKEVFVKVAEGLSEEQKKEFIVKDNVGFGEWEWDVLANDWDSSKLDEWGLDVWQNLPEVEEPEADDLYTKDIKAPVYETKNEKPETKSLINQDKKLELIKKIKEAKISKEDKDFLIMGAERHNVFDYGSIADFYAHSKPEVQELMEQSALVIIDFKKAVENGYVSLTNNLNEIYDEGNE